MNDKQLKNKIDAIKEAVEKLHGKIIIRIAQRFDLVVYYDNGKIDVKKMRNNIYNTLQHYVYVYADKEKQNDNG